MSEMERAWSAVDGVIEGFMPPEPSGPRSAAAGCVAVGLPAISVSPALGRLLGVMARMSGARRALEVGTLGGYSTAWIVEGMGPRGRVTTIEIDAKHAAAARKSFAEAGLSGQIDLREGAAKVVLAQLVKEAVEPYDLVFIDADKQSCPEYFQMALRLTKRGSVIIIDNVVREGAIVDAASTDERVIGVRRAMAMMGATANMTATAVQTVGVKGWDGFAVGVVG
ncbi:O-methyltransferase [soil metagenome]